MRTYIYWFYRYIDMINNNREISNNTRFNRFLIFFGSSFYYQNEWILAPPKKNITINWISFSIIDVWIFMNWNHFYDNLWPFENTFSTSLSTLYNIFSYKSLDSLYTMHYSTFPDTTMILNLLLIAIFIRSTWWKFQSELKMWENKFFFFCVQQVKICCATHEWNIRVTWLDASCWMFSMFYCFELDSLMLFDVILLDFCGNFNKYNGNYAIR